MHNREQQIESSSLSSSHVYNRLETLWFLQLLVMLMCDLPALPQPRIRRHAFPALDGGALTLAPRPMLVVAVLIC